MCKCMSQYVSICEIDQLDAPQCAREWHVMTHTDTNGYVFICVLIAPLGACFKYMCKQKQTNFYLYKCIHTYTCVCACSHGFLGGIVWVCSCVCLQICACRCGNLHVCVCLCNGVSACSPTIPETNMSRRRTTFESARGLSHFFCQKTTIRNATPFRSCLQGELPRCSGYAHKKLQDTSQGG